MIRNLFLWLPLTIAFSIHAQQFTPKDYFKDINQYGQDPVKFANACLSNYDLLVFDDALHSAYEPFVFYNQLINTSSVSQKFNYLFLEVISTTAQPLVDSFLNNPAKDSTILIKAF
jgi:hypothetical protein